MKLHTSKRLYAALALALALFASSAHANTGTGSASTPPATPPPAPGATTNTPAPAARREDVEPTTLADARTALAAARAERNSAETARDTAQAEASRLAGQFDAMSQSAETLRTERDASRAELATVTGERNAQKERADLAAANVSRLEKIGKANGWDLSGTPASATVTSVDGDPAGGSATLHVLDQWIAASGDEKMRIYQDNKREIRQEQDRRALAGKR